MTPQLIGWLMMAPFILACAWAAWHARGLMGPVLVVGALSYLFYRGLVLVVQ